MRCVRSCASFFYTSNVEAHTRFCEYKENEARRRGMEEGMLMMPHSVSQVQIKTENKQQKKWEEPGTSKQVNWRCWMLQVCGRPGKLTMKHLFISSHSDSTFTHSLLHLNYCVPIVGKASKYTLWVESTQMHQKHKELFISHIAT